MTARRIQNPSFKGEIKKTWAVFVITLRSRLSYFADLIGSSLFLAIVMFVFVKLWSVTYQKSAPGVQGSATLGGLSLNEMIWYLVATETIIMSMPLVHRLIEKEIKDGDVAIRLNKPIHFVRFHWAACIAEALTKAVLLMLIGGLMAYLLVGGIEFNLVMVPFLVATLIVTFSLNFLFGAMIGLLAFWLEDITGVFFVFDRAKWLLGGFIMPISLFPDWLKQIAELLPSAYMINQPALIAIKGSPSDWLRITAVQLSILLVMGALAEFIYQQGVRRLDVNGG